MDKKETLAKASEITLKASKVAWKGSKIASAWTYEKSKEGIAAYKRKAKRQAVLKRQAERIAAEEAEQRRIEQEIERQRQAEEDVKYRKIAHDELLKLLDDDFNVVSYDLTPYARCINDVQAEKYLANMIVERKQYGASSNSISQALGHNLVAGFDRRKQIQKMKFDTRHMIIRTIADLSEREIGILKLSSFLWALGVMADNNFQHLKMSIVYNGGNSTLKEHPSSSVYVSGQSDVRIQTGIQNWLKDCVSAASIAVNEAIAEIGTIRNSIDDPKLKSIIDNELKGASGWLRASSF
ncbi:hypothetical protein [Kordiimonas pumila]|uniref:Uncharacterized protein n=1 Tax=Kordiimonas pumila TaxID=2161677 RepID=A0ABV7D5D8_9PROT|nr:hypothetical protein [Kordiimonas pumila]